MDLYVLCLILDTYVSFELQTETMRLDRMSNRSLQILMYFIKPGMGMLE